MPAIFATGAACVKCPADFGWFVCHFSVAGLSYEILARRERCSAVDQPGHGHFRSQEAHFQKRCQCFDAKTVTPTFISTPAIPEFPWIQRGVDW